MFWKLTLTLILALVLSVSLACPGNDDDDDDDDDDDRISDVPDDVNDFLDPEDISALESAGMAIYKGDNPPNVESLYALDSLVISYDEIGMEGQNIVYYEIRYYDQTVDGDIMMDYEAASISDVGTGIGALISGDGDCFTVYSDARGNIQGCEYHMPSVYSGCLNDTGIQGFQWGLILKEKSETGCDALMPEGAARIIDESDDMATNIG